MPPKKGTASTSVRPDGLLGQKCIVTGKVDGMSRKGAEQILVSAGATIEKSLNKKVTLVVLGDNPGDKKLEKIEQLGCASQEWDAVIEEIKIDGAEITESPAKEDEDPVSEEEENPVEKTTTAAQKPAKPSAKAKSKAEVIPSPAAESSGSGPEAEFLAGKKVLITGTIPGHTRKAAQEILEEAGAQFAKSLNKQVELVILGIKPGRDKLSQIEELKIKAIKWADVADKLGLEVAPERRAADVEAGSAPDSIVGMTLLITGEIDGHTRTSAQKVLQAQGAKFAKSLNKSVELVVLGINAGPDKLDKISNEGIATCTWDELIEKLDTDATASKPPKKKAKKV